MSIKEKVSMIGSIVEQARTFVRMMQDKRVPTALKLIPLLGVLYVISPIDLIPEMLFPGIGYMDDLGIVLLGAKAFMSLVEKYLDEDTANTTNPSGNKTNPQTDTVDATWRVKE